MLKIFIARSEDFFSSLSLSLARLMCVGWWFFYSFRYIAWSSLTTIPYDIQSSRRKIVFDYLITLIYLWYCQHHEIYLLIFRIFHSMCNKFCPVRKNFLFINEFDSFFRTFSWKVIFVCILQIFLYSFFYYSFSFFSFCGGNNNFILI